MFSLFSSHHVSLFFGHELAAQEQGGLLSGKDPTDVNPSDPLRLWIIQVGLIVLMTQFLSVALKKLRQPRVIAEVLGGILLGPTAFGRIPGFTDHIFPEASIPYLTLVANIGLVLFLFLVGLEIDMGVIRRNARMSALISLGGMTVPFGIGAGMAVPLYREFVEKTTEFAHFMLFCCVAFSITAFPVLCRILTELKLLDTTVGICVLSAGVGNDIVGWTLLALSVALVNASSGITAVYILLCAIGWAVFLLTAIKWALHWLARYTGSIENGPTMFFMTVTMLLVFGSAFFTDVIGVHAIFGGFLAGLIVPREGGLAIELTEKLEDMVSIIFLPLYFTLSGLSTNLGLLNTGKIWGYTIGICTLAYAGKFGGCAIAARYAGFGWRESSTVGTLMSCKGLVELIVLNVGLSAGILDQRVFSMFVFEALVLTFMTTPVVTILYPPHVRTHVHGFGSADGAPDAKHDSRNPEDQGSSRLFTEVRKTRFTIVLDKIEHLPGMLVMAQLLRPAPEMPRLDTRRSSSNRPISPLSETKGKYKEVTATLDALRVIELSDRTSAVMRGSAPEALQQTDPLLNVMRTFGAINDLPVIPGLLVAPFNNLATSIADHAKHITSNLVILPWLPPNQVEDHGLLTHPSTPITTHNPFEAFFKSSVSLTEKQASHVHSSFIRGVFAKSYTDVALFVDRAVPGEDVHKARNQHIILPFFGGPDDRVALELLVQLAEHPSLRAVALRVTKAYSDEPLARMATADDRMQQAILDRMRANGMVSSSATQTLTHEGRTGYIDTEYGQHNTLTIMQSATADELCWGRYANPAPETPGRIRSALSRIKFESITSATPLQAVISRIEDARMEHGGSNRLLVFIGRSRRLATESHHAELKAIMQEHGHHVGSDVKKTIGDVGTALFAANCRAGIVVFQEASSIAHCDT